MKNNSCVYTKQGDYWTNKLSKVKVYFQGNISVFLYCLSKLDIEYFHSQREFLK